MRLAAADELGAGGDWALESLSGPHESYLEPPAGDEWQTEDRHQEFALRAWLAPLLAGSTERRAEEAMDNLEKWLDRVRNAAANRGPTFPLSLEVALGQGFKHAANRRAGHPHARSEARSHLVEKAQELLETATFWHSRVTLVHAMCLWSLRDLAAVEGDRLVGHWLGSVAAGHEHPFVAEARALAVLALQQQRPEQYRWMDESVVAGKIGDWLARTDGVGKRNLWIRPRSAGPPSIPVLRSSWPTCSCCAT